MGQKVNPHGLRVGVIKDWDTQWFADKKDFAANIKEDYEIRNTLKKKYYQAAISKINIERAASKLTITVYTARPGVLIGKQGAEIEEIKKAVAKICKGKQISVNISERRVYKNGVEIPLKNKEFELLVFLMNNKGIVFDRERLYENVWGMDAIGDNATVAVHINRLREKLEDDPETPKHLLTVRGAGYRFE